MALDAEQIEGLGVALNEATLMDVLVNAENFVTAVRLSVLTLPPEDDPRTAEPFIQIALRPTGRIAASFRHGSWDDPDAPVERFELEQLSEIVARVGGSPI